MVPKRDSIQWEVDLLTPFTLFLGVHTSAVRLQRRFLSEMCVVYEVFLI